jgi:hypothetical protein
MSYSLPPSPTLTAYTDLDLTDTRPITPLGQRWDNAEWSTWTYPVWHIHYEEPEKGARWYHYKTIGEFDNWHHVPFISPEVSPWAVLDDWEVPTPAYIPANMIARDDPFLYFLHFKSDPNSWVEDLLDLYGVWPWLHGKRPHAPCGFKPHPHWTFPNLTPRLIWLFEVAPSL